MISAQMAAIEAVFGKPAAITVQLNGQTVINQGEFAEPKRLYNGRMRVYR
jgi:hypothetical protein